MAGNAIRVRKMVEARVRLTTGETAAGDLAAAVTGTAALMRLVVQGGANIETVQARVEYDPTWLCDEIVVTGEDKS